MYSFAIALQANICQSSFALEARVSFPRRTRKRVRRPALAAQAVSWWLFEKSATGGQQSGF